METLPNHLYLYQMRRSAYNTRQSYTNEEIGLPLRVIFVDASHAHKPLETRTSERSHEK